MTLPVVEAALVRIKSIAADALKRELDDSERASAENEIRKLIGDIHEAIDDRNIPAGGITGYTNEKLNGVSSFALIAIGVEPKGFYSDEKIIENLEHYSYLVGHLN